MAAKLQKLSRIETSLLLLFLLAFSPWQATVVVVSSGQEEGHTVKDRIAGGQDPPEGKYPSLARVHRIHDDGEWFQRCVATILNRDWILSSGSCFASRQRRIENASRYRVVVGDSIQNETEPYEQILGIERFIIHERIEADLVLNSKIVNYDIAVAKVVPPIKFSHRVSPVNLPICDEFELGTGWIPGWGLRGNVAGPPRNNQLKEVYIPIVTNEECNKWLKDEQFGGRVNDLHSCTRNVQGMGWCWFDSGAPLFLIKNESYMVQVGIASVRPYATGGPCGEDGWMTVYMRVSRFLGWIHRRISGCGNHPFYNYSTIEENF